MTSNYVGDQKVTLNHLVDGFFSFLFWIASKRGPEEDDLKADLFP